MQFDGLKPMFGGRVASIFRVELHNQGYLQDWSQSWSKNLKSRNTIVQIS